MTTLPWFRIALVGLLAVAIQAEAAPLHLRVLVQTNDVATGSGAARGFAQDGIFTFAGFSTDYQFGPPVAASGGYYAFQARAQLITPENVFRFNDLGIWGGAPGRLTTLMIQQGAAPGTGTNFVHPGLMNVSSGGLVALYGDSWREDGLWKGDLGAGILGGVEPVQFVPFNNLLRPWQTEDYIGFYGAGGSNFIHNTFNQQTKLVFRPAMPASVFGPGVTLTGAITVLGMDNAGNYILQSNASDGTNRIFLTAGPDQIVPGLAQGQPAPGIPNRNLGFMFASANVQGNIAVLTRLDDGDGNPFNDTSAVFAGSVTNASLLAQSSPGQLWGGGTLISSSNHVMAPGAGGEVGIYKLPASTNESLTFTPLPPLPNSRPPRGVLTSTATLNALGQYAVLYNDDNGPDLWFYNPGEGWTNVARRGVNLDVSGQTIATYNIGFVGSSGGGTATGLTDDGKLYFMVNGTHIISGDSAPRPNIELIALEVNQAVQDWNNSVLLVENKKTYVRAFVQTPDGTSDNVLVKGARLRGFRNGSELPGSPLLSMNPGDAVLASTNVAARRHQLFDSLVYLMPYDWRTGTVELQFEWTEGEVTFRDPAEPGGAPADGRVRLAFQRGGRFDLKFVRVAFTNTSQVRIEPVYSEQQELKRRLVAIYPIDDVRPQSGSLTWNFAAPPYSEHLWNLNLQLQEMRNLDGCGAGCHRLYYGFMAGDLGGGEADDIPGTVASGWMPLDENEYGRNRHAHELGHLLGRAHPIDSALGFDSTGLMQGHCGELADPTNNFPFFFEVNGLKKASLGPMGQGPAHMVWGLNTHPLGGSALTSLQIVNPTNTYELMSYCTSPATAWRWISAHAYTNLYHVITNNFPPTNGAGAFQAAVTVNYLLFSGAIDVVTDAALLRPVRKVQFTGQAASPVPGAYLLRLLNGAGAVLTDIPFSPNLGEPDAPEGGRRTMGTFVIPAADDPAIRQVQVLHNGQMLIERQASANAPVMTVLSPNGGEVITGDPVLLQWQGRDTDGDDLSYVVQFSSDGGQTWETLALDLSGSSYAVPFNDLKGTTQGRTRVLASDGFNTASDVSDGDFEVANHAPDMVLLSPADNELVTGSQQILLETDINDLEDERLPGNQVRWSSNLDGPLGVGAELNLDAANLTEGDHLITATATDSHGTVATKTFRLRVRREVSPLLEVERVTGLVRVAWPAALVEHVLERSDSLAPGSWTPVQESAVVVAGMKRVSLSAVEAQTFFRLRKP